MSADVLQRKKGKDKQKIKQEAENRKRCLTLQSNVNHFSSTRIKTMKIPEMRNLRPPGLGTFLRLTAFFCMWPSYMCSQDGCCTSRNHNQDPAERSGQVGERQKVSASEFAPCHKFSWKPNSDPISSARTVLGLPGRMGK